MESLLIAAVFQLAIGNDGMSEELFSQATLKDADAAKNARSGLVTQ